MCIIVAKPMGIEFPEEQVLLNCFNGNSDGAGFMYADGKSVRIRKGFMKWGDFIEALDSELPAEVRRETAVVMHFRIATSGKVQPACCHPFPISSDPKDLSARAIDSRFGIAHNGIISGRYTKDGWSDTMDFIADVVDPLSKMNPSFMFNSYAIDLLEGACGSKLAIMDNAGDIATVGEFIDDGGVLYSNTSYLAKTYGWSSYGTLWDGWDDVYGDKYGAAYGDLDTLVEMLPYEACAICPVNYECAQWEPECASEKMADQACNYYMKCEEEEEMQLA